MKKRIGKLTYDMKEKYLVRIFGTKGTIRPPGNCFGLKIPRAGISHLNLTRERY